VLHPDQLTDLVLLTDLYQLTMAYGYWKLGRADTEAVFHLFFRRAPFGGGYAIAAGIGPILELLPRLRFERSCLEYLQTLQGQDGNSLFGSDFLDYLASLEWKVDIDAVAEGSIVFGHEPLVRVRGPMLQCQLLETLLLNGINFQTLIATKAARICTAAQGEPVLEFGLRRAQGMDGGLAASRAAYIGGCAATSNVLAGKRFGIPVKGTHAHSWVMSFDTEDEAFASYASAMPNNCVFLVDTYDTLDGVRRATEIGHQLRRTGHELLGVRLDSGDLAYLSIEARKILDQAGFPQAVIVASNDLDEHIIENLKTQGARIAVWGVGTKLATAYDQPALGGVYKLGAIRSPRGDWQPRVKLSEQSIKTSIPGTLQVRRWEEEDRFVADVIYPEDQGLDPRAIFVDLGDGTRQSAIRKHWKGRDLLRSVVRLGQVTVEAEPLPKIRDRAQRELSRLHPSIRRFLHPHEYPVGLDIGLHELRTELIQAWRDSRLGPSNEGVEGEPEC